VDCGDGSSLSLTTFTLCTWFKTSMTGASGVLLAKGPWDGPATNYCLQISTSDKLRGFYGYTSGWTGTIVDSASTVNDGAWHFGALTYDGTTVTLYLDDATPVTRVPGQTIATNTNILCLGAWNASGDRYAGSMALP